VTQKKIVKKIYALWGVVPTPLKIIAYVLLGGILSQAAQDLASVDLSKLKGLENYAELVLLAIGDILVWGTDKLAEKALS
jgi:hypothetical protein